MSDSTTSLLIDLDGVIYEGDEPVAGAPETIAWLNQRAVPHLFLTNTTSKPRSEILRKLEDMGIAASEDLLFTPPVAASAWLREHAPGPIALFVPEATRADFQGCEVLPESQEHGAAAVVIGDLGRAWTFDTLNRAFRLLMSEPRPALVALGMTRYWRADDGLRLDVAPFVKALEHAASCRAVVLGKPSGEFFQGALHRLGCRAQDALMIGDDIVGDVQGAQRAGISAVLVKTGKFLPKDLQGEITPDELIPSIASLKADWSTIIAKARSSRASGNADGMQPK